MPYAVKGGIGDFLQCLPFMLTHPDARYYVATHHNDAAGLFGHFGIAVKEVPLGHMPDVELCPRQLFFDRNPFPPMKPIFSGKRPVVGVHLGGSKYSLSIEERFGFPPKALPRALLEGIVLPHCDFLLFGSPPELFQLGPIKGVKQVKESNIIASLSRVAECSAFIGSDSAFKTMSAMLGIPTFVLAGDYKDRHRDERFIEPYVDADVMSAFYYNDLTDEEELKVAVKWCRQKMEVTCSLCLT